MLVTVSVGYWWQLVALQRSPNGVFAMSIKPLLVDWNDLKKMGWPYARAHTWRLMFDPLYAERRFPACRKLGSHRNSHPVWLVSEVLAYFEGLGLRVTEDWNAP